MAAAGATGAPLASMTTSNPMPSRQLEQQLGEVAAARVHGLARAEGRRRRQPIASMSIATTRPSAARRDAPAMMNEPMPPAPMTATVSSGRLRDARECVERDGERLRHRGGVVVARVGNETADGGGRDDVLGEPSVDLEAERAVFGAQVRAAANAPETLTARDPCA